MAVSGLGKPRIRSAHPIINLIVTAAFMISNAYEVLTA